MFLQVYLLVLSTTILTVKSSVPTYHIDCNPTCHEDIEYASISIQSGTKTMSFQAQPLGFGSTSIGSKKDAIVSDPYDACSDLKLNTTLVKDKFLVVSRGNCEFSTKAMFALERGAAGVIFINDDNSDVFTHIYCSAIDVSFPMPLLILPMESGKEYVSVLSDNHTKNETTMSPFVPLTNYCVNPDRNLSQDIYSLLWQGTVLICLVFLASVCFMSRSRRFSFFFRSRESNGNQQEEEEEERSMSQEHVDRLTIHVCDGQDNQRDLSCSICLDEYEEGCKCITLPCQGQHVFHAQCIRTWLLESSRECPLCKSNILEILLEEDNENQNDLEVGCNQSSLKTPLLQNEDGEEKEEQ